MHKIVSVNELKEGMIISHHVKNRFGQLILASDQKIEEKHLNVLKIWGIQSVSVIVEADNETEQIVDEYTRIEAEIILNKRLFWTPENSCEKELYEIALMHVIQKHF